LQNKGLKSGRIKHLQTSMIVQALLDENTKNVSE